MLRFPSELSRDSTIELEQWLMLVLRRRKRIANRTQEETFIDGGGI